jgi:DNA replication protein
MIEFKGFPVRMRFTPIPNIVFSSLLPQIFDIAELKVLLYIFELLYPKKGKLRFVTEGELKSQVGLTEEQLHNGLAALLQKGAILHLMTKLDNANENVYFLNTEANQFALSRIRSGEVPGAGFILEKPEPAPADAGKPADIFCLYEQNIGMLTPLIADELKDAIKHYPETWIKDAIREAANQNRRNWRYISRVLEHWSTEGKDDGAHRGYPKKNADPGKYTRGKYGHMVQ